MKKILSKAAEEVLKGPLSAIEKKIFKEMINKPVHRGVEKMMKKGVSPKKIFNKFKGTIKKGNPPINLDKIK